MTVNRVNPPTEDRSKRRGSGFTNINRIIQANQNNRLGSTLQSGITKSAEDTKQDVQQQTSGFQQQAQAGRLGNQQDKERRQEVFSRFDQSGADNTQYANEKDIKDFERFRSGEYKGPLGLASDQLQKVQGKAQQAETLGKLTQSAPGQQQLLRRFAGGEGYTRGQQRLDTLLLGQTGGENLRQARRETVGLGDQVSRAAEGARQQGESFRREAEEFGAETREGLTSRFGERDELTQKQAEDMRELGARRREEVQGKLAREELLTKDDLDYLGLAAEEAEQLKLLMDISGQEYISSVDIAGQQIAFQDYEGFDRGLNTRSTGGRSAFGVEGIKAYEQAVESDFNTMKADRDAGLFYDTMMQAKFRLVEGTNVYGITTMFKEYPDRPDLGRQEIYFDPLAGTQYMSEPEKKAFNLMFNQGPTDEELRQEAIRINRDNFSIAANQSGGGWAGTFSANPVNFRNVSGTVTGDNIFRIFKDAQVGQSLDSEYARQLGLLDDSLRQELGSTWDGNRARITGLGKSLRDDFEFERYLEQFDPTQVTQETAATQDQLAQMNALQRLMGQEAGFDESLAGTATEKAQFNTQQAIDDAINDLFGKGEVVFDEQGRMVPTTTNAYNMLAAMDSIWENPFVELGTFGMSQGFSEAAEAFNKIPGIEGVYDAYDAIESIGGDLNPLELNREALQLGSDALNSFTDSVSKRLNKAVGTVICGELHRQGIMSDELYKQDCDFAEKLKEKDPEVYEGYYVWAKHVAKLMSKSKLVTDIMTPFGMAWARQMAGQENILGKSILTIGKPICKVIGKIRRFCLGVK